MKRTPLVSWRVLTVRAADGNFTHLFISELESGDGRDDTPNADGMAEVCQAAFGMTCAEKRAEFPPLVEMRTLVRREILYSNRQG
ncbi:MAG: hypothetical protein ABIF09_11545 [Gemmatimonadota bacterium]